MNLMVRPALADDAETLLSLIDAFADYEKLPRPTETDRRRLVADAFGKSRPRFKALLALDDDRPVGYAIFFETYSSFRARPTLYLEDLFVIPSDRNNGVGGALFAEVQQEAVRKQCGRIEWICLNWNELGINFYTSQGAQHMDEWRIYRLDLNPDETHTVTSDDAQP